MPRLALLGLLWLIASPAQAQNDAWCQELWLSRNTVFDRAGQCFASNLGRAVFDNSDCTGPVEALSPLDAEIVRQVIEMEDGAGCNVDTSAHRVNPEVLEFRARLRELWTVPVRADSEHGCGGYRGPVRELHAGISTSTGVIGYLWHGNWFSFVHQPLPPNWEYITVSDGNGERVAHGWVQNLVMSDDTCDFMAG
ncbi:DUF4453 domain-containing protein [Hasllibacter sp. MH4015]|uniref:DUF4453 domain-containing protein n=1 Tax=Hasllibacter sp. MH4015 TaxID=2854029 RepID=UPI001CD7DDF0|nr:DUF4453 domain-containing protein [Hasllibacter sp. MH4015]